MVNGNEFKKQFGNMGIDHDSVKSISDNKAGKENQHGIKLDAEQEINLLKRKLEYLQNNILKQISSKFDELEKKIEAKTSANIDHNREMTAVKNDISDLKKRLGSVKIVFGEKELPQTSSPEEKNEENSSEEKGQGNIKVEDYFNYSNKKFD